MQNRLGIPASRPVHGQPAGLGPVYSRQTTVSRSSMISFCGCWLPLTSTVGTPRMAGSTASVMSRRRSISASMAGSTAQLCSAGAVQPVLRRAHQRVLVARLHADDEVDADRVGRRHLERAGVHHVQVALLLAVLAAELDAAVGLFVGALVAPGHEGDGHDLRHGLPGPR